MNPMTRRIKTAGAEEPGRDEIPEFIAPHVGWIEFRLWDGPLGGVAISDVTEIDATKGGDFHLPIDPTNSWLDKSEAAITLVALVFHTGEAVRQTN